MKTESQRSHHAYN